MRRQKYPKNLEARKKLIKYLIEGGATIRRVKFLIGYHLTSIDLATLSLEDQRLLNDDEYRCQRVEYLLQQMRTVQGEL